MDAESVSRLRRVVARLARSLNAEATVEGLTPTQASVLAIVTARGPLNITDLSQIEHLNPTMLSRVIGKLDDNGLIARTPDPEDLRAARVEATARGRRISERMQKQRTASVAECVAALPDDQADALAIALPALEALVAALQDRENGRRRAPSRTG